MDEIEEMYLQDLKNYKESLQKMTQKELIEEGFSAMFEDYIKLYFEEIEYRYLLTTTN